MAQLIMGFFPLVACISVAIVRGETGNGGSRGSSSECGSNGLPLVAQADSVMSEARPVVERDSFEGRGQRFIPWPKS